MVRQAHLIAVVLGALLIAGAMVGCGGATGNVDEREGERGAAEQNADATADEETTSLEGDRTTAEPAQEPVGFDAEVVSSVGQANLPAGFGEGTLWATGFQPINPACDDVVRPNEGPCSASASSATSASPAGGLPKTLLKRVDSRTGEEVAAIPLKGFFTGNTEMAFGAGSVWASYGDVYPGPVSPRRPGDVVLRIDPRTNRVVDRIPVDPPSGLAFGHGSVWATSAGYGTLSRIDPQTGEVVAKVEVGRGAVDIATDERSGAVWVASVYLHKTLGGYDNPEYSEDRNLTRVDPATNRVVEEILIEAHSQYSGGAYNVAVGEGAVWVLSGDCNLLKVDPATNEIAARVSVGDSPSQLAVYGGAVWAMVQVREFRLARVDPRTMQVVAAEDIGPIPRVGPGGLAAGGGYVWFSSGDGLARVAP